MTETASEADSAREMRIGYLTMLLHTTKDQGQRREVLRRLEQEIKDRSDAQVEKMERDRGLR